MNKLSVFILTFNEERLIEKCLKKLTWVDDIVIVDSGSTDSTLEICKKYNANIFHRDFDGFGAQKQFAINQTKNDWVLSLDADEILTNELVEELQKTLTQELLFSGYYLKRKNVFLDKEFKYGPESRQFALRLFNKSKGKFDDLQVHENIILEGETAKLKHHMLHFKTRSLDSYLERLNRYASITAEGKYLKSKKYTFVGIFFRANYEFVKKYFIELNILNGKEGFYWAFLSAYYTGLKCIKTNEQYKIVKKQLLF